MPVGQPIRLWWQISQTHSGAPTRIRNDALQNLREKSQKSVLKLEKTGPVFPPHTSGLNSEGLTRLDDDANTFLSTCGFGCLDQGFPGRRVLLFISLIADFPFEVMCVFNEFS